MNTFICNHGYAESAAALDYRRLGKQRIEVWQMLKALTGMSPGWARHPAVSMWRGHERQLAGFGIECHNTWIDRGYRDTTRERLTILADTLPDTGTPWWIDDPAYRTACRSVLIGKDPRHYGPLWPGTPEGLGYLYPDATKCGVYIIPKNRT